MDQTNSEHLIHDMRLRVTDIERLQRENAELLKYHNELEVILQAKLAAAEADRDNWRAAFIKANPTDYTRATKAAIDAAKTGARCPTCNGNDADTPCAYPSDGMPGCLRDKRLAARGDKGE